MTRKEFVERHVLPLVIAFGLGALATNAVRDWRAAEEIDALIDERIEARLEAIACPPVQFVGADVDEESAPTLTEEGRLGTAGPFGGREAVLRETPASPPATDLEPRK